MDLVTFFLGKQYADKHFTKDYNELQNQPQINGVTLSGNKTTHNLSLFEQVTTMPEASAEYVGKVVQFIGTTTTEAPIYVHGYFYECKATTVEEVTTYAWEAVPELHANAWELPSV